MELHWTKEEARWYLLHSLGLHGRDYPPGEEGIRRCFLDLDVLQLDPLPILGRSHDLVIQARVDGTHPGQVLELAHRERLGFEYWDKMLSLIPIRHFPQFRARMEAGGNRWERQREERLRRAHPHALEAVYDAVKEHGPLSSRELRELGIAQEAHRGWKSTRVANAALIVLWNRGKLSVSHRVNFRRYFDLTERAIPAEYLSRPAPALEEFQSWHLIKRVRNAGLLPLRGDADTWAFLRDQRRSGLPERLVKAGRLVLIHIEGVKAPFLAPPDAEKRLEEARRQDFDGRAQFLSPLDPLLWSRKALKELWDFEYAWEVYKPPEKRRWGYYVLPVLYGDRFVARFDGKFDAATGTLCVLSYWEEPGGLAWSHPGDRLGLPTVPGLFGRGASHLPRGRGGPGHVKEARAEARFGDILPSGGDFSCGSFPSETPGRRRRLIPVPPSPRGPSGRMASGYPGAGSRRTWEHM